MSTWLNGLGPDRPRPRQVPSPVSREEINRAIEKGAIAEREAGVFKRALTVSANFLHMLQDFGFHSGRGHKRFRPAPSTRAPETIVASVRAFFAQRPRPWCSPNARGRTARKIRAARAYASRKAVR